MRKTKRRYGCPVEFSIDLLSGKWKTVILSRLKLRPMRYGELREAIPALSDKVLRSGCAISARPDSSSRNAVAEHPDIA